MRLYGRVGVFLPVFWRRDGPFYWPPPASFLASCPTCSACFCAFLAPSSTCFWTWSAPSSSFFWPFWISSLTRCLPFSTCLSTSCRARSSIACPHATAPDIGTRATIIRTASFLLTSFLSGAPHITPPLPPDPLHR